MNLLPFKRKPQIFEGDAIALDQAELHTAPTEINPYTARTDVLSLYDNGLQKQLTGLQEREGYLRRSIEALQNELDQNIQVQRGLDLARTIWRKPEPAQDLEEPETVEEPTQALKDLMRAPSE